MVFDSSNAAADAARVMALAGCCARRMRLPALSEVSAILDARQALDMPSSSQCLVHQGSRKRNSTGSFFNSLVPESAEKPELDTVDKGPLGANNATASIRSKVPKHAHPACRPWHEKGSLAFR